MYKRQAYSRVADALTPMAKGLTSEYCNQNAYDCIQIHGGSGFMKDYACERIYRDARITSIYEGTTQLQVVAAIRHVTTGTYLELIRSYAEQPVAEGMEDVKAMLEEMTTAYSKAVEKVAAVADTRYTDFMARRLVEMAGGIVMSYLLLLDTSRTASFARSTRVYAKLAQAEVAKHAEFINSFSPEQMSLYEA